MIEVVGVSFKEKGQVYFFSPNGLKLKKGLTVIVETERGIQFAKIETDVIKIDEKKLKNVLKPIIRVATNKDFHIHKGNIKAAKDALKKAKQIIEKKQLNMQLIDATYTFDREQLIFKFLSDKRIDFRELVKDFAALFHTRIELRQIGARDKAKEIGGCGMCGRNLCCSTFLTDMDSVTIGMAKNQNISLNPNKINGLCGRLLCCLKYEDKSYSECKVGMPVVGKKVKTEEGEGIVTNIDILNRKYYVNIEEKGIIEVKLAKDGSN